MAIYTGFKKGMLHSSSVRSHYYCRRCNHPVSDFDRYCPECGGAFRKTDADEVYDELHCPKCGWNGIVDNLKSGFTFPKYCPNCGTDKLDGQFSGGENYTPRAYKH